MIEYLPVVDETGKPVGRAARAECHGNPALVHPVVHLHVFNRAGEILLQRRSPAKDLLPGYWDSAVGGHIAWGETAEEALLRETREELGIPAAGAQFLYSYLWCGLTETEFVYAFKLSCEGPFRIDPGEVAEIGFFSRIRIEESIAKGLCTPNFVEEHRRLLDHGDF